MPVSVPHSEKIVVAALFGSPGDCDTYCSRIRAINYSTPLLQAISSNALDQLERDGVVTPDPVAHVVAETTQHTRREVYIEILECMEFMPFVIDHHSVGQAIRFIEQGTSERIRRAKIESLAMRLTSNKPDLNQAASQLDDIINESSPVGSGMETLASCLKSDLSDEPMDILRTGLDWFDDALPHGGFQRGDKVVFSAPPGAGKTALALQVALNILDTNKDATVVWGLGEMTERALRNRALQCASGLTINVLRRQWADLSPSQHLAKSRGIEQLSDIGRRFFFLPAPLTPRTIEEAVVRTKAAFVAIDYLQLVRPEIIKPTRRDEVDEVVREFMRISQRHSPVLFLISDQGKGAEYGRDIFSAFKESSEIAFAADLAYVAEVMDRPGDNGELPEPVDIRLRCLKARHGKTKDIRLQFSRDAQSFAGSNPTLVP